MSWLERLSTSQVESVEGPTLAFPLPEATSPEISKKELRELKVERQESHGEWNDVIRSRMQQR